MTRLIHNSYGKSRVRLTKVTRHADRHDLREVTVEIELEGDFDASYTDGDNSLVIATDTMKNTVYALARHHPLHDVESFGIHLASHFADGRHPQVRSATVRLVEDRFERIAVGGVPHPTAFAGGGSEKRVATVVRARGDTHVASGIEGLFVLKTTDSAFEGFARDAFTTLPEAADRILATVVTAWWTYSTVEVDWNAAHAAARAAMLEVFATHFSPAVQTTLFLMGEAALEACPEMDEISITLPNAHRIPVNLTPFGMDNLDEIFVATDEPHGTISGTLRRD